MVSVVPSAKRLTGPAGREGQQAHLLTAVAQSSGQLTGARADNLCVFAPK
jgi:hypothetical protein